MDQFTRRDLRNLLGAKGGPRVSMFMPMHRTGREVRENHIHLKNALAAAEERLLESGVKSTEARAILEPARKLASDNGFLQRQSDGLALFAAPGDFFSYRLPLNLAERVIVADQFHVRPMLRLLQGDGAYYLLAASQNSLRLFRGSHYSISELDAESLPGSLREALNIDEYKQSIQHRSYTSIGVGGPANAISMEGQVHGHGGSNMDVKKADEIREFFIRVSNGLDEFFREEHDPLVFAGVEYLFPIFKDVCRYKRLLGTPVRGNPDGLSMDELHSKAWNVVEPVFREAEQSALGRFSDGLGGDLVSTDLRRVLRAAREGRVDTLLFDPRQEIWGQIDSQTGDVSNLHDADATGAVDLIDHAVSDTLLTGGTAYSVEPDQLPEKAAVGAIFRYRATEAGGEPRGNEKGA